MLQNIPYEEAKEFNYIEFKKTTFWPEKIK